MAPGAPAARPRVGLGPAARAVLACGVGLAACGLVGGAPRESAPERPVTETFPVPTFSWDRRGGMDAMVSGTLAFTDAGCPLLVQTSGATPRATAIFFPDAVGLRYENDVRAVADRDGRVYAVEGRPLSYGGGWQEPASGELAATWEEQCADTPLRDAVVVNDVAGLEPPEQAPDRPSEALPTAPSTAEVLGFFPVPTFQWHPADGGDGARVEGTVTFTHEGCPVVHAEGDGTDVGLVLPHAQGFLGEGVDQGPMVYSTFPEGTSGLMAMEGEAAPYRGGEAPADDPRWTSVCPDSPVDRVFLVQQTP